MGYNLKRMLTSILETNPNNVKNKQIFSKKKKQKVCSEFHRKMDKQQLHKVSKQHSQTSNRVIYS